MNSFPTNCRHIIAEVPLPFGDSGIVGLGLFISPSAIFRRVVSVIIDAIKCVFRRRSAAHIGKKFFVGIPSLANLDSATSPVFKSQGVGIIASLSHKDPSEVLFGPVVSMFKSGYFLPNTSAGLSIANPQMISDYGYEVSAIADAVPSSITRISEGDQSPEALISKVKTAHMRIIKV